jgi:hypothetical protein
MPPTCDFAHSSVNACALALIAAASLLPVAGCAKAVDRVFGVRLRSHSAAGDSPWLTDEDLRSQAVRQKKGQGLTEGEPNTGAVASRPRE